MTDHSPIPRSCDVLIIGGGPAGSATAGFIAKEGYDVVVLDRARHPRPQVGGSLVPHFWRLTDLLGASEAIAREGFVEKAGGIVAWDDRVSVLRFKDFGYDRRGGLHVERARFDEILLDHAADLGALVFEAVDVESVDLSEPGHPAVIYRDHREGRPGIESSIEARFVVDASGHQALLSNQLGIREVLGDGRKFMSLWGAFEDARFFDVDGASHPHEDLRTTKPVGFIEKFDEGWLWHAAVRDRTSVGIAMATDRIRHMGQEALEQYYLSTVRRTPHMSALLRDARLIPGSVGRRLDYSRYSQEVVGDDYFCVGDAAAFVDPIFSQGVLACLFHASTAGWAITNTLRNSARRAFYQEIYQTRVLQYYSASRLIGVGDFGGAGIDPDLARKMVRSLPKNEVDLLFSSAWSTGRDNNMLRVLGDTDRPPLTTRSAPLELRA